MSNEIVNDTLLWEPIESLHCPELDSEDPEFAIGYVTSRTPIPTGWIVQNTVFNEELRAISTTMITIEDPNHTWVPINRTPEA